MLLGLGKGETFVHRVIVTGVISESPGDLVRCFAHITMTLGGRGSFTISQGRVFFDHKGESPDRIAGALYEQDTTLELFCGTVGDVIGNGFGDGPPPSPFGVEGLHGLANVALFAGGP